MNLLIILSGAGSFGITVVVIFVAVVAILSVTLLPISIVRDRYRKFVQEHSLALRKLKEINKHYEFNIIPSFDMKHSYDNEKFYSHISCQDYLTYQLVYIQRDVKSAIKGMMDNKYLYEEYKNEIINTCTFDRYDTEELLKNRKWLKKTEEKLFAKEVKTATTEFSIKVILVLTNINGDYQTSKVDTFSPKEIMDIIAKLNKKYGDYYLDEDIWDAICRVERGKVTNKMRFAIYKRDNYRCRKCGRRTDDLEIDHIIPIAKGGKTIYSNLQTLCHRCNSKKGANIEY